MSDEKKNNLEKILRERICSGLFLIGLGILFLISFRWPLMLVLVGLFLICEGLVKYYFKKQNG